MALVLRVVGTYTLQIGPQTYTEQVSQHRYLHLHHLQEPVHPLQNVARSVQVGHFHKQDWQNSSSFTLVYTCVRVIAPASSCLSFAPQQLKTICHSATDLSVSSVPMITTSTITKAYSIGTTGHQPPENSLPASLKVICWATSPRHNSRLKSRVVTHSSRSCVGYLLRFHFWHSPPSRHRLRRPLLQLQDASCQSLSAKILFKEKLGKLCRRIRRTCGVSSAPTQDVPCGRMSDKPNVPKGTQTTRSLSRHFSILLLRHHSPAICGASIRHQHSPLLPSKCRRWCRCTQYSRSSRGQLVEHFAVGFCRTQALTFLSVGPLDYCSQDGLWKTIS